MTGQIKRVAVRIAPLHTRIDLSTCVEVLKNAWCSAFMNTVCNFSFSKLCFCFLLIQKVNPIIA